MARTRVSPNDIDSTWPRWINLVLGVWLLVSAFSWLHSPASFTNTWVVGALITLASLTALFAPQVRYVNTALAVWLFISTLVIDHVTAGTAWNNAIVAIAVFALSLVPTSMQITTGRRTAAPMTP